MTPGAETGVELFASHVQRFDGELLRLPLILLGATDSGGESTVLITALSTCRPTWCSRGRGAEAGIMPNKRRSWRPTC